MAIPFLDTNIILRHLLGDNPIHSPLATAWFQRVERGELQVYTSEIVIFEAVFTLERHYRQPKQQIREAVLGLIQMPGIILVGKRRFEDVFRFYVDLNLPFADAYHVVMMQQLNLDEIISFDRDFDRVAGITRRDP